MYVTVSGVRFKGVGCQVSGVRCQVSSTLKNIVSRCVSVSLHCITEYDTDSLPHRTKSSALSCACGPFFPLASSFSLPIIAFVATAWCSTVLQFFTHVSSTVIESCAGESRRGAVRGCGDRVRGE